jgi:hypothetical protein
MPTKSPSVNYLVASAPPLPCVVLPEQSDAAWRVQVEKTAMKQEKMAMFSCCCCCCCCCCFCGGGGG